MVLSLFFRNSCRRFRGFTLAELLIALGILGVIATFTIPKILSAQQNNRYNAAAKEAAATISAAYKLYTLDNGLSSTAGFGNMTQYINYVSVDTSRTIDSKQTNSSITCSSGGPCIILHNGGAIRYISSNFAGAADTNALEIYFDPNGTYGGTTDGPDKAVDFFLYYNGRIATRGTLLPNTTASGTSFPTPSPTLDPPWFSW
jgi:prepilin-type N-terminal cleavage/methylation domain-containing protein